MASTIAVVGNVGKDPVSEYTPNGFMVTKFSVAVSVGYGDKKKTNWYECALWGEKPGATLKNFVQKGTMVFVSGKFSWREWKSAEGGGVNHEIEVNEWSVLKNGKPKGEQEEDTPEDEGPF